MFEVVKLLLEGHCYSERGCKFEIIFDGAHFILPNKRFESQNDKSNAMYTGVSTCRTIAVLASTSTLTHK